MSVTTSGSVESDRPTNRVLNAAAAIGGPAEVLEFLLPLWAGSVLGAGPAQVGLLVATGALAALLARYPLGHLADRADRLVLAAVGAGGAAVALAGLALVEATGAGIGPAFVVAALSGAAGAATGVGIRSWLADRHGGDVDAYGVLLTAESQGAGLGYVVAFVLLGQLGYPPIYVLGAAACLLGGGLLVAARSETPARPQVRATAPTRRPSGPLNRFLVLCGVTAAAETAVVLLLLLHLQNGERLGVYEIAYALAPGLLAFIVVPRYASGLSRRAGPGPVVACALLVAASFGVVLATGPGVVPLSAAWTVAAAALAAALPVEQSLVARSSPDRLGVAMSRYESAQLVGATAGSAGAGLMYEAGGALLPGVAAAAVLVVSGAAAPALVRALPLLPGPAVDPGPDRDPDQR
ncbi:MULTISPECIES: MFS transporter [unclassified Pseudonocardia]|uniref:MFS transporter n=1 Tax=unclassified Pseudonocardia TaxID=2619320 RepID=UPI00094AB8A7|nr:MULTISPECIES: MFS transporter [unclassified Pseudonocardia]